MGSIKHVGPTLSSISTPWIQLEVSLFLKFRNCEPQFQGRNQFFSMNWTNNQYCSMVPFLQKEEL